MGGDHAPSETVAGAVDATLDGVELVLVGDEEVLRRECARHGADLPIVDAPETITMGEDPARAIREKTRSSVVACARMVTAREVAGFVSAGSTGAAMAAAAIIIGRIPGVLRPTIASVWPTPGSPTVVLDSGANPEVKPEHLLQFGEMGSVLAEVYFDLASPRVGLLNIGEEAGKGRAIEKAAYALLAEAPINFVGNVEGRDLAADKVDVIVTDGFTGNVFLKTAEGAVGFVVRAVMDSLGSAPPEVLKEVTARLEPMRRSLDYESTGGGHLLGIEGVVVIAHGSSSRRAIASALGMAWEGAENSLVDRVRAKIAVGP